MMFSVPRFARKHGQKKKSEVPKRGRSKRGRTQKHANERKRAQTQVCKRAQKSAST